MISDKEANEIKKQLLSQISKMPEEQVKGLKEKIREMTNEELEKFVKEQATQTCIFCQVAKNQIKSYKIYEDKDFVAVLEIMPATKGHTLIIPKKHLQFLTQMSDEETKELFSLSKKIIPLLISKLKCLGVDMYIAQGISQRIPHLALNLIPRYEDDKINFVWERKQADENELKKLSEHFSEVLEKTKKVKKETKESKKEKEERENEIQKLLKHIKERLP